MKFKKGDPVKIISGKDKGKTGKITQTLPKYDKLVVEGLNKMKKHLRSRTVSKQKQAGQIIEFDAPLHVSNIALVCNKCNKPTRIRLKLLDGKKIRMCAKCKEVISNS